MSKLVVSLTTIPSRVPYLSATLDSLLAQNTRPDAIEINVPRTYRRPEFGTLDTALLPDGLDVHMIGSDYGPATKILPTVERYRDQDALLVYCDDDYSYDPDWLTRLTETAARHPEAVIAERWRSSLKWEGAQRWMHRRNSLSYRLRRIASLGLWRPLRTGGYVPDIAEGAGGVLIRPHFVDAEAYDIPDKFWAVDDIWLSGIFQKNGHPVVPTGISRRGPDQSTVVDGKLIREVDALLDLVHDGMDRWQLNVACIEHMRARFGVFDKGRISRS
ncbi:glycosyltransferase family 2 protein [Sagittula sp.]|uniref:glycosyltransferase family 2 protein n=1 Tax=Sagittula sp. TaxID=2038081 RepID=UPI003511FC8E